MTAGIREVKPPRSRAFAREDMSAQTVGRNERVGEVRGVVVDPVLLFDPPPRFHPSHDRVAIGHGQGRVGGNVVQRVAIRKKPPALRSAGMFARERKLFGVDRHALIVGTGISSAAGFRMWHEPP